MVDTDEQLQRMHGRISAESTDKEANKMDVAQLRRIVELHLRQLSSLAFPGWSPEAYNRFKNAFQAFDQEVKVGSLELFLGIKFRSSIRQIYACTYTRKLMTHRRCRFCWFIDL